MNISPLFNFLATLLTVSGFLVGCDNDKKSDKEFFPELISPIERDSYELVKVQRPTSVDEYFKSFRAPYQICVALAKLKKIPVKPFAVIPKDFFLVRTTVKSDGKSFRTTEEEFGVDFEGMSPENGCETRIEKSLHSWVEHNGFQSVLGTDAKRNSKDGSVEIEMLPYSGKEAALYPISKKINGISLKCTDSSDILVAAKAVDEICVLDPIMGKIAMADGKPPIVYIREAPGTSMFGTIMIHEPLSLKIGLKVNPAIFFNENEK